MLYQSDYPARLPGTAAVIGLGEVVNEDTHRSSICALFGSARLQAAIHALVKGISKTQFDDLAVMLLRRNVNYLVSHREASG